MSLSRRASTATETQEKIKQFVLSENLRPGDLLPTELELCERLGVSRSSVREAVRTLAALDMVDVRHGTGTFVGHLSLAPLVDSLAFRSVLSPSESNSELRQIVETRTAIDLGLTEQVVQAMAGNTNPGLHELVDEMVELAHQGKSFAAQDRKFHSTLLTATTGNELIVALVEALWDVHTILIEQLEVPTPDDIVDTAKAHGAMVEAAEAGDAKAYREAVDAHYAPLLRNLGRPPVRD